MAQCMIRIVHVIRWAQAEVVHGRNETQAAKGVARRANAIALPCI